AQTPKVIGTNKTVYFLAIYLWCVVVGCGAKTISIGIAARVNVRAAVGDQMRVIEHGLKRKTVIVAVASAPRQTHGATINEDMVTAIAKDKKAALWNRG